LNVRESCHTVALWPKRYFDIDTCKFDSERIETIYSQSLGDLWSYHHYENHYEPWGVNDAKYPNAWFVPKDNDFDKEEEERERIEKERQNQNRIKKEKIKESRRLAKIERLEWAKNQKIKAELDARNKEKEIKRQEERELWRDWHLANEEEAYRKQVEEAELRALRYRQNQEPKLYEFTVRTNISKNSWNPK